MLFRASEPLIRFRSNRRIPPDGAIARRIAPVDQLFLLGLLEEVETSSPRRECSYRVVTALQGIRYPCVRNSRSLLFNPSVFLLNRRSRRWELDLPLLLD